jgi:glycosyltransferase involved in cell wall biosynthesis
VPTVFFAFRDAPERRAALSAPDALDRYRLFGLDQVQARGARVRHNLERDGPPPLWARATATAVNRSLQITGGYGGDFATALASLRLANDADVVFATSDTVGIPLVLLKRLGLLRPPIVYAAIGLQERLMQLRGRRTIARYRDALSRVQTILAHARSETEWLRDWLGPTAPPVVFLPFGVDIQAFRPEDRSPDVDVVSVGADPRRDYQLLLAVAGRRPELSFRIVATADQAKAFGRLPANVAVETDIVLERVRDRLAAARIVALPVRANSYTGATTVLLQAMAMAKPVVVSSTDAIADGYALADGVNCRLVDPADLDGFERALLETLGDGDAAAALGGRARRTVEHDFSWERYSSGLWDILSGAWERDPS